MLGDAAGGRRSAAAQWHVPQRPQGQCWGTGAFYCPVPLLGLQRPVPGASPSPRSPWVWIGFLLSSEFAFGIPLCFWSR